MMCLTCHPAKASAGGWLYNEYGMIFTLHDRSKQI